MNPGGDPRGDASLDANPTDVEAVCTTDGRELAALLDASPPGPLDALWERLLPRERSLIGAVRADRDAFMRWPTCGGCWAPGAVRQAYHTYSPEQHAALRARGVAPDTRSNGPAVMAFLLAGGERPLRANGRKSRSIHHIYDGQHPAPGRRSTTHAVKDGRYFTEAAGLVAVHPVLDALADEYGLVAWLLRWEAWRRFGFDPDGVFGGDELNSRVRASHPS